MRGVPLSFMTCILWQSGHGAFNYIRDVFKNNILQPLRKLFADKKRPIDLG